MSGTAKGGGRCGLMRQLRNTWHMYSSHGEQASSWRHSKKVKKKKRRRRSTVNDGDGKVKGGALDAAS